jgi:hypothetical protein
LDLRSPGAFACRVLSNAIGFVLGSVLCATASVCCARAGVALRSGQLPTPGTSAFRRTSRQVRTRLNALPRAPAGPGVAEKHADAQEGVGATTAACENGPAPVGPRCMASVTTAGSVSGQSGHPSSSRPSTGSGCTRPHLATLSQKPGARTRLGQCTAAASRPSTGHSHSRTRRPTRTRANENEKSWRWLAAEEDLMPHGVL